MCRQFFSDYELQVLHHVEQYTMSLWILLNQYKDFTWQDQIIKISKKVGPLYKSNVMLSFINTSFFPDTKILHAAVVIHIRFHNKTRV